MGTLTGNSNVSSCASWESKFLIPRLAGIDVKIILLFLTSLIPMFGFTQSGLQKINGTKLFVEMVGKGEPLLIVHGGPGLNHTYFLPHLEQLAKKYKLVFYDQRACGRSAIPSSDSISLKFFADDIEGLRKFLGVEKLNILSHSWGAVPAVEYGILYPGKVNKMIFVNPVPLSNDYDGQLNDIQKSLATDKDTADRAIIRGSRSFKAGNSDAFKQLIMLSFRHEFYNPENISKLQLELPSNFAVARKALIDGLTKDLTGYNFYDQVKSFPFPVLIMAASKDVVPMDALTLMKQNIPGSQLVVFSKSGHFIFIEEKKKFTEEVVGFLKKNR